MIWTKKSVGLRTLVLSVTPRIPAAVLVAGDGIPPRRNLLESVGFPANRLAQGFEVRDPLRPVVGAFDLDVRCDVSHPDALSLHAFPL